MKHYIGGGYPSTEDMAYWDGFTLCTMVAERRACSVRDITRWMTEQLVKDYSTKNNHDQFVRAWKELGRYSPEVKEYVEKLESLGITHLGSIL